MSEEKNPGEEQEPEVTQEDANQPESKSNDEHNDQSQDLAAKIAELEKKNEGLRKTMSSKDKKHKTTQEQIDDLTKEVQKQSLQISLSKKLDAQENLPAEIKQKLRQKLDSIQSEEQFDDLIDVASESVNVAKTLTTNTAVNELDKKPDKSKENTLHDQIKTAKSPEDFKDIFNSLNKS